MEILPGCLEGQSKNMASSVRTVTIEYKILSSCFSVRSHAFRLITTYFPWWIWVYMIYRVSQDECARLREGVPYVKVYRYNPKHLCPKLNGYGDNGKRSLKLWQLGHPIYIYIYIYINYAVYKITWEKFVEPGRPQMTMWRMSFSRWTPKATNKHSEYVTCIVFPLQQWLQKRALVLRYTYIVSLVCI